VKKLTLAVALALSGHAYAETYYTRPLGVCEHSGDGSAYDCAASPGAAGAWLESGNVSYGNTGTTFGRGDSMYICGRQSTGYALASLGAFDGVADTAADIVTIRFDCPNDPGSIEDTTSGHGILASSIPAVRVIGVAGGHVEFRRIWQNAVAQFLSSSVSSACVEANGFKCFHVSDIDCEEVGVSAGGGHCVTTTSSGFGNFPATAVTGVIIENSGSYKAAGAACHVAGHYDGAIIDNCRSDSDGLKLNTWGVYQRGESRNIGFCGAGMTWDKYGASTVVKTTVPETCIPAGKDWIGLHHLVHVTGVDFNPELTQNETCVDDPSCTANLAVGEWNHIGNVLYMNRGTTPSATASVNVVLAYNTNAIIRNSYATNFGPAFDGVGIGLDLAVNNGRIEFSESEYNSGPGFSLNLTDGVIFSSIARDNGRNNFYLDASGTPANIHLNHKGRAVHVTSIMPAGVGDHFNWRTHYGHTIEVKNSVMIGGAIAGRDKWLDGGTVDWDYNAYEPGVGFLAFVGAPSVPASPAFTGGANDIITDDMKLSGGPGVYKWQPRLESPLCGAGEARQGTYYNGKRIGPRPDIGALPCESWR
jgi:hypothetical protein